MTGLIGVDWGTSSLRAARIGARGEVLDERAAPRGILGVEPGQHAPLLAQLCAGWPDESRSLVLLSGMVGSRQGWQEAGSLPCPSGFAEIARGVQWLGESKGRRAIVPGLNCVQPGAAPLGSIPDMMRGEETQVFGALDLLGMNEGTFVLPGTHSKWVQVRGGRIDAFSTFMTGEFYALLRQHSILARTLPADDGPLNETAFLQGVAQARETQSLLRSAFSVRTLALAERLPPASMPSYLSGLLIGEELRSQVDVPGDVVLIGADALTQRYALALDRQGTRSRRLGAAATWRGLWAIAQQIETTGP